MTTAKIHPIADVFPMMPDGELQALAADIQEHGLLHPIIRDEEGQIIDGRNRLRACELAGVEPRFEDWNGSDVRSYIASANLQRRNLTKGQQAMALAFLYPEPEKGGRGKKSEAINSAESAGFSARRLNEARSILRYSRELAECVLEGLVSFDKTLEVFAQYSECPELCPGALMVLLAHEAYDWAERTKWKNPAERLKVYAWSYKTAKEAGVRLSRITREAEIRLGEALAAEKGEVCSVN